MIKLEMLSEDLYKKNQTAFKYLVDNIRARDNKIHGLDLFHEILKHIDLYPNPSRSYEWAGVCPKCSEEWVFNFDFLKTLGYSNIANFSCSKCAFSGMTIKQFHQCLSSDPEKEQAELQYAEANTFVESENEEL